MQPYEYDWWENDSSNKDYGARILEGGVIRVSFDALGTYWDVRLLHVPGEGVHGAIYPKGCTRAVYTAPISCQYLETKDKTNKLAREALYFVSTWLKRCARGFYGNDK